MTGEELRAWRTRHDWSVAVAADKLGLSRMALYNYESGTRPVPQPVALATEAIDAKEPAASGV